MIVFFLELRPEGNATSSLLFGVKMLLQYYKDRRSENDDIMTSVALFSIFQGALHMKKQ
jgi:hypothetical protein